MAYSIGLPDSTKRGEADRARARSLLFDVVLTFPALQALLHQLRAATGLGGKARGLKDPVERARKAVTARIRDAIRRIKAAHPELGAHLQEAILTGVSCAYRPSPPVRWSVSPEAF